MFPFSSSLFVFPTSLQPLPGPDAPTMNHPRTHDRTLCLIALAAVSTTTAATGAEPRVGEPLARRGDEIVVCGQLFHTTAPVVLWTDPGGYDAYRVDRRFGPVELVREKAKVKERNEVT